MSTMFLKLSVVWILLLGFAAASNLDRVCQGSENGLSHSVNSTQNYRQLFDRYCNCSIVNGNLEITGLTVGSFDVSFLQNIEMVTGYVIIAFNSLPYLPLVNLKMIGGKNLFQGRYSLFITGNDNSQENRLMDLRLKSLKEIVSGSIYIGQNKFCFLDTINWNDVLNPASRKSSKVLITDQKPPKSSQSSQQCDPVCEGRCWGAGPSMCQTLTSVICAKDCGNTRCRGPSVDDCCDRECAIGCTGPTNRDCIACLNVNDDGQCKASCPAHSILDPETGRHIPNANIKYRYMDTCVDQCPGVLLVEDGHCVQECKVNFHDNGERKCVPCENGLCDTECYGIGHKEGPTKGQSTVNSNNINFFEGCNKVKGNLVFQSSAFTGDRYLNISALTVSQLRILQNIKIVTGYVSISNWHRQLRDFSILQNLKRIYGDELYRELFALVIVGANNPSIPRLNYLSQITSLGFRSLEQLTHGNVYIGQLKNLCYDRRLNWARIIQQPISHRGLTDGIFRRNNRPLSKCDEAECDSECTSDGCWGPGPLQCLTCLHASYNGACVQDCTQVPGVALYQAPGETVCRRCDPQCRSCFGERPDQCTDCLHFQDDLTCVDRCPANKYLERKSRQCLPCHSACLKLGNQPLCSGPNATIGIGGCNFCDYIVLERGVLKCMAELGECPFFHFSKPLSMYNTIIHACIPCYIGCEACSGPSREECTGWA